MKMKEIILLTLLLILVGCDNKSSDDHIFTLYTLYESKRLHVATFDATPNSLNGSSLDKKWLELFGEENAQECNKAAALFHKDLVARFKTIDIKYWCEKGRYRK
jgi:hypothetical protein